jgi:hypothetical protein
MLPVFQRADISLASDASCQSFTPACYIEVAMLMAVIITPLIIDIFAIDAAIDY